jgi:hypothetical protein
LPFFSPIKGSQPKGSRELTRFLCADRGVKERKEGGSKQHLNKGDAQQGRGSKQHSSSAVSRLDSKEGGDIQAYPRWRHTPSKDHVTKLTGRYTKTLSTETNIIHWSICLLVGN